MIEVYFSRMMLGLQGKKMCGLVGKEVEWSKQRNGPFCCGDLSPKGEV